MASRKPVTAAEIVEVLQGNPWIQKGHALPWESALMYLRINLHTTRRKVTEWLLAATGEEPHEFELIGTVGGYVRSVGRAGEDVVLDEAGYTDEVDRAFWPQLTRMGEPVSKDADADDGEFLVLSKDLLAMCRRSARHQAKIIEATQRAQQLSIDGAEERYGDSLAYIRGLLRQAGIPVDAALDARYLKSIDGDKTTVSIVLRDGAIDAFANVLAAHDVEPYPPTQIVTRLPQATDA